MKRRARAHLGGFGLSGADGGGDARDLLSARHRAVIPHVSLMAGLGVELLPVEVACLSKKDVHEPILGGWRFGLSDADRAGDARDLLSARHRAGTPLVGPLAGLGVELQPVKTACLKRENAVSDMQIGHIGTQEDNQTSNA